MDDLKDQLTRHEGLLENLTISIGRQEGQRERENKIIIRQTCEISLLTTNCIQIARLVARDGAGPVVRV